MSNDTTEWRDIPGWEGLYQVSNDGQVRRLIMRRPQRPALSLVGQSTHNGYRHVILCSGNATKTMRVHRLVMLAFAGKSDLQVNHKNGNRIDNRLINLEYCTRQENITHAYEVLGWSIDGTKNPLAKLDDEKVREIRRLYAMGIRLTELARLHKVDASTLSYIVNRKTWRHVE